MRTTIVFVLASIAAAYVPPAMAEQWVFISKTTDPHPAELFLDMSSISEKNDVRVAQTKAVPLAPWPENTPPADRVSFGLTTISFDCNAGLVKVGSTELHYADGRLGFMDIKQSWEPVDDPSTKRLMDLVCAWGRVTPSRQK